MRMSYTRAFAAIALITSAARPALAQSGADNCASGNPVTRSVGGASLGAALGFFAYKVRFSDWNPEARTPAATRSRNQAMIGGALLGAVVSELTLGGHMRSCTPGLPNLRAPARNASVITAEEIEHYGSVGSAYDLVHALRPQWLTDRGVTGTSDQGHDEGGTLVAGEQQLVVYLDNARLGRASELQQMGIAGILSIRYFDAAEATLRWGAGHTRGAIQVITQP